MKRKGPKRVRSVLIFLLLAAAVFGGWRAFAKTEVKNAPENASYSLSADCSAGDYKTVSMKEGDVHSGNLVLINPQYACRFHENEELISVLSLKNTAYKVRDKNVLLKENVITAFNNMMMEFKRVKSDNAVNVISGYRTEPEQQQLFDEKAQQTSEKEAAMWVAKPGFSEHHSGLALDLGLYFDNGTSAAFDGKGKYTWMTENGWKYGFIWRYPKNKTSVTQIAFEPWHLRYVGAPHAFMMKEKGLCLEEYIDFLRDYAFDRQHLAVSVNGNQYDIYFVPGREVPVPGQGSYEISGNNVDGFIVTVKK